MKTWKVVSVVLMSSKTQTSPTFKLLASANAFHPLYESPNLLVVTPFALITCLIVQTLPSNIRRNITSPLSFKWKYLFANLDGIFCNMKGKRFMFFSVKICVLKEKGKMKDLFSAFSFPLKTNNAAN